MVDAIVSFALDQLISTAAEEAKERVRLVAGVDQEVKRLRDNFETIQALLVDAERRQVKEPLVRIWLEKLKHASYDMEDVLDEWNTARHNLQIEGTGDENAFVTLMMKVCPFFPAASCFGSKHIFLRHDIALKIKEINENLDDIAKQKDMFNFNVIRTSEKRIQSTALINVSEVCGRDEEMNSLKSKLLCDSSAEQNAIQIISLVGMGGIGKTTLAQCAYNDNDVMKFFDIGMWVCVSDNFDELRVAKAIVETLEGSATNLSELNSLLLRINASTVGKRFFLVLDDMWTDDYRKWEPFRTRLMNGLSGSKILVTTRKETVAQMMKSTDVISIKELSEQKCWLLFKRLAFFGRHPSECKHLEKIGRKIVAKCKGLPLAAKTVGSLLYLKRSKEEWESILNSEMWELEELKEGLLAPLPLSYYDLPPAVKQCFSCCAVFPKDYDIEKDELIRLWMAQGYIRPKRNKELEMIGEEYFDCLATRSFFQEFVKYDVSSNVKYKMHDIVHDFAQYLTKRECFSIKVDSSEESLSLINSYGEKLRHSMLVLSNDASFPASIFNASKLRSLLINSTVQVFSPVLRVLFNQFTCLRTLKIAGDDNWGEKSIVEIPKEIESLIHLKYLKLESQRIEELPETCCELFNLQAVDIEGCSGLKRLAQGIEKLVNLRHLLYNGDCLEYMPKGIERLTSLRTLTDFVALSGDEAIEYGSKACNLEGLRHLNHLRGFLRLLRLGNVTDVNEAKNAHLEKKTNLVGLELWFTTRKGTEDVKFLLANAYKLIEQARREMNQENGEKDEAICEALRPPPNLEALKILHYKGKTGLPSWILSLNKLKDLQLTVCGNCEFMPSLGKLPSLEILVMREMYGVKRVGCEFLGIESSYRATSSSSSIIPFPKLKQLTIEYLSEWEEWEVGREDITIMPQLNSLEIGNCRKLKSLPDQLLQRTTLKKLKIYGCPVFQDRFKKDIGEDWSKISHIPNIYVR